MKIITPNPVKENRCGRFSISEKILEEEPFLVMEVMGRCIVVEAQNRYYTQSIEYYAYSPEFEVAEHPAAPPVYSIICTRGEGGEKIKFEKSNDEYNRSILRKITF